MRSWIKEVKIKRIEDYARQEKKIQGIKAFRKKLKKRLSKWKNYNFWSKKNGLKLPLARYGVMPKCEGWQWLATIPCLGLRAVVVSHMAQATILHLGARAMAFLSPVIPYSTHFTFSLVGHHLPLTSFSPFLILNWYTSQNLTLTTQSPFNFTLHLHNTSPTPCTLHHNKPPLFPYLSSTSITTIP